MKLLVTTDTEILKVKATVTSHPDNCIARLHDIQQWDLIEQADNPQLVRGFLGEPEPHNPQLAAWHEFGRRIKEAVTAATQPDDETSDE